MNSSKGRLLQLTQRPERTVWHVLRPVANLELSIEEKVGSTIHLCCPDSSFIVAVANHIAATILWVVEDPLCSAVILKEWDDLNRLSGKSFSSTTRHIDGPVTLSGHIVECKHIFTIGSCTRAIYFARLKSGTIVVTHKVAPTILFVDENTLLLTSVVYVNVNDNILCDQPPVGEGVERVVGEDEASQEVLLAREERHSTRDNHWRGQSLGCKQEKEQHAFQECSCFFQVVLVEET